MFVSWEGVLIDGPPQTGKIVDVVRKVSAITFKKVCNARPACITIRASQQHTAVLARTRCVRMCTHRATAKG